MVRIICNWKRKSLYGASNCFHVMLTPAGRALREERVPAKVYLEKWPREKYQDLTDTDRRWLCFHRTAVCCTTYQGTACPSEAIDCSLFSDHSLLPLCPFSFVSLLSSKNVSGSLCLAERVWTLKWGICGFKFWSCRFLAVWAPLNFFVLLYKVIQIIKR